MLLNQILNQRTFFLFLYKEKFKVKSLNSRWARSAANLVSIQIYL